MKLLILIFIPFVFAGCSRAKETPEMKTSKVTIRNSSGLKVFSATSDGPFIIEIGGADVDITLVKEEPSMEEEMKDSSNKGN